MFEMQDYILFGLLAVACITDIKYQKLPNWLTAGGMVVGLIFHLVAGGIDGFIFSFLGLLAGGGIFLLLYLFKAIGAGDVKLFAAIGSLVGVQIVLYMMMYSVIFAGILGIIILLLTKTFLRKMTAAVFEVLGSIFSRSMKGMEEYKVTKATRFPFMYAVAPATVFTYYYMFF